MKSILPKQLEELRASGASIDLIDVRTPVEFREVHLDIARNVPLDRLDAGEVMEQRNGVEGPLYVICQAGQRSTMACEKIVAAGYDNVVNIEGGTQACDEAGMPMARGKKAISLERQVRIAAGFFVLLGVMLGWLIHPSFFALSAIVGAGLMFAGITNTCGMGMLLSKMPWNQVSPDCDKTSCST